MSKPLGIVATGHVETSHAATEILKAGGNAFDAAIAALCAACVAEPMLASLGGGGFMVSRTAEAKASVHDFFCQTPAQRKPADEIEFYPILADFGTDTQVFHVGMGAIAVPGVVAGMYQIHNDLCRMPMAEIMQPAIELANRGLRLDSINHYTMRILEAILRSSDSLFELYESPSQKGELIHEGENLRCLDFAETLETLALNGEDFFYRGEWAQQLARDSRERGGSLTLQDLESYRVERRPPLCFSYQGAECMINPPPSPGGCLIAFALGLISQEPLKELNWGGLEHVKALIQAQHGASRARLESHLDLDDLLPLLDAKSLDHWRKQVQWHSLFSRGTTHISVVDASGNTASLTASNGEGNHYVLPGTGIILNNMLGEEDLNPDGFQQWREGVRLASMMSPMIARQADGSLLALGSGGSNRIRSAITQVLINHFGFGLDLADAVNAPRLHLESGILSHEEGFAKGVFDEVSGVIDNIKPWPSRNLFFGGVHAVKLNANGDFEGAGDPRRNGSVGLA